MRITAGSEAHKLKKTAWYSSPVDAPAALHSPGYAYELTEYWPTDGDALQLKR